jgi:hypothetical protein
MNHNQPQFVPQPVPAITHKPTLSLTDGPATEQVLSQMLSKAEAHTPDELCRLLRDRSDKLALAFATSGANNGVFLSFNQQHSWSKALCSNNLTYNKSLN